MKYAIVLSALCLTVACTDTQKAQWIALGNSGHIKCYSGNNVIFEGDSTGKIETVSQSDGWEFKDAKTGKLIRVSGACVIVN